MKNPIISVIMPAFNAGKTIERALNSVVEQTFNDFEVIVIDDGSTDNTYEIVKKISKIDSRIRLFQNNKNIGAGKTRNKGIKKSQGSYIVNLDADDTFDKDALDILAKLVKNYEPDVCFIKFRMIYENKELEGTAPKGIVRNYPGTYTGKQIVHLFLINNEFFYYGSPVLYKRQFLTDNDLYYRAIKIGEGGDFVIRALFNATKVMVLDKKIENYFVNESSITHSDDSKIQAIVGRVIQFETVLEHLKVDDSQEWILLCKHLRNLIYGSILNLKKVEIELLEAMLPDIFSKQLFQLFCTQNNEPNVFISEEELSKIKTTKNVILYGAGRAVLKSLRFLSDNEISVSNIAVTNTNGNRSVLYGYKVMDINEINVDKKDTSIVICANRTYYEDIYEKLCGLGYSNIFCIDFTNFEDQD